MRQRGPKPVVLWSLINSLANARNPDYRAVRRCWRLRYWGACRELFRVRLLFRHGGQIALSDFATSPRPGTRARGTPRRSQGEHRLSPSVGESTSETGGSKPVGQQAQTATKCEQAPVNEMVVGTASMLTRTPETESVPTPELVSAAARQLARLPRRAVRRWSGWLTDDVRSFRNMRVRLPGSAEAFIFGVLRRRLVYTREPDGLLGDTAGVGKSWGVVRADQVQIIKNEHAVTLGKRKAGVREAFSQRKAQAARRNGAMPTRRGQRGRPPKLAPASVAR